nr:immunoglobulin light chain junction region [Macaca mulatta]MPN90886.1 immunoglobulin light chain junction region [Macaca mulatta]MPN91296.1 immunoglobulin light chain junction region [Macaca mulatta]MPN92115.1 immunoglobulin light chain junction region [Macaca mulatta]MPN92601.1 immunoglobulin light chain junction region [Macaca mulatta]
CLQGYDNPLTF